MINRVEDWQPNRGTDPMNRTSSLALDPDKLYEVVDGEPQEKEIGGAKRGGIRARLMGNLSNSVDAQDLGGIYGPDTPFQVGGNERIPDVAFVAAARIPETGEPHGLWPFPPDLAVQVVSPNDLHEKLLGKIAESFAAGARQGWVISPEHRTVTLYRSMTHAQILSENDELTCDELFPGFQCPVAELFRTPARR
jgi:Uma2 family endonuclease